MLAGQSIGSSTPSTLDDETDTTNCGTDCATLLGAHEVYPVGYAVPPAGPDDEDISPPLSSDDMGGLTLAFSTECLAAFLCAHPVAGCVILAAIDIPTNSAAGKVVATTNIYVTNTAEDQGYGPGRGFAGQLSNLGTDLSYLQVFAPAELVTGPVGWTILTINLAACLLRSHGCTTVQLSIQLLSSSRRLMQLFGQPISDSDAELLRWDTVDEWLSAPLSDPASQSYAPALQRLVSTIFYLSIQFGGDLTLAPTSNPSVPQWLSSFSAAQDANSPLGPLISSGETSALFAASAVVNFSATEVSAMGRLVNRWNNTVTYWSAGITTVAQLEVAYSTQLPPFTTDELMSMSPYATSPMLAPASYMERTGVSSATLQLFDFVDMTQLQRIASSVLSEGEAAAAQGLPDLSVQLQQAALQAQLEESERQAGVCATATAELTRTTLTAELEDFVATLSLLTRRARTWSTCLSC